MTNAEEFIEQYKAMENTARDVYSIEEDKSVITVLKRRNPKQRDKIQYCADIRNFFQHEYKIDGRYPLEPDQKLIDFLKFITSRIRQRKKCSDIAVKINNVLTAEMTDSIRSTMAIMREKKYTHVPIVEGKKVIGVFDENSLFEYIADDKEGIFEFGFDMTFSDIRKYLSLESREMEEFIFYPVNGYVDELSEVFSDSINGSKRLSMVFLTASGKPHEPLQGIITPWDILAAGDGY